MLKYIQQNTLANKATKYPSKSHPTSTIYEAGCGVCSSLMVLLNSTDYTKTLAEWALKLISIGARGDEGTDMMVVAKYMKDKYGFKLVVTSDINNLTEHLKKGYKAVCHVGQNGLFSTGGHYVCGAGLHKDGRVIILDSYYYTNKYTSTTARSKAFEYNSNTDELYVSAKDLESDARGSKYYLFTPTKNIDLKESSNSVVTYRKAEADKAKKKLLDEAKADAERSAKAAAEKIRAEIAKQKNEILKLFTVKNDTALYFTEPTTKANKYKGKFVKGDTVLVVKGGSKITLRGAFYKAKLKGQYYYVPAQWLKRVK